MIDHKVTIGGTDVSNEVISIKVEDQIDTSSNPGKITIVLANRPSKYGVVMSWIPQTTEIEIIIKNWVYSTSSEKEYAKSNGKSEATYLVAYGHMTDRSQVADEVTVIGECDMGHLADALGDDYKSGMLTGNAAEDLKKVLALHKSLPIKIRYYARNVDYNKEKNYNSETTFQEVVEDIAYDVGAVYYFDEEGVLEFRDPRAVRDDTLDLDPYVINPDDTKSLMGFRNRVTVIADQTLSNGEEGSESPGSEPIMATAEDEESIAEIGILEAPTDRAVWIGTQEEAQARADLLLNYFKMFKNALTKPKVHGIIPKLQQPVKYSVFVPISKGEAISGDIEGVTVARSISYSIDGIDVELTVSPGILDMETYIGDEDIEAYVVGLEEY